MTLSQVSHFDDGAAVWVCLCRSMHHDNVWEEMATVSIQAGVVLGKKKIHPLLLNELKKSFVEFQIGAPAPCTGSVFQDIFLICHDVMKPREIICRLSEAAGRHQMGG